MSPAGRNFPLKNEGESLEKAALAAMTRARATLVLEHPFFGSVALRMTLACDKECADLWADGRTLACNPAYASSLPENKLVAALAHEVLHIALGHHVRRGGRNERLWNRACDFAVNAILAEAGFSLPDGAPWRQEYAGKSADDIYAWLARLQDDESHGAATESKEGEESSADADGSGSLGGEEGQENESRGASRPREGKDLGGEQGGHGTRFSEAAQGPERDAEHDFSGEVRDHPLLSSRNGSSGKARAGQESDIAMVQAMQEALRMGDMPAGLARMVRSRVRAMLDWRQILARFIENCSDSDYSWTQPDRRYIHQGLYLPSRREAKLPEIVLAVDCSGSVDAPMLERFCAELSGILETCETTLTVLYHDMHVNRHDVFTRQDMPFTPLPVGGGGTDFRPVPEYIEELGVKPACLLWFTDLECDRFPEEPAYPVLWITPEGARMVPPFGEMLEIPLAMPEPGGRSHKGKIGPFPGRFNF
ncbi:MAG: hypothetical protein J6I40_09075 [Mailhella sp.]|nr:hypothetical protein [Mailhella sp.]